MSDKIKTIIVDDEMLARKGLSIRLEDFPQIDIIEMCTNGREAVKSIESHKPDLVFLDIQMPSFNGFEVVEELEKIGCVLPQIIFVTAFDQYAIKAFEIHAVDYLLKPVDYNRLKSAIEKVEKSISQVQDSEHKDRLIKLVSEVTGNDSEEIIDNLENNNPVNLNAYSTVLAIKDVGETTLVPIKDILCIDAAGDYMCVHTNTRTHILRKTMKELEEVLDPRIFLRIHRSSIVNKSYIDKFGNHVNGEYYLILTNGNELKVSRSYKDKVKQAVLG